MDDKEKIDEILQLWFNPEGQKQRWWGKNAEFDAFLASRYGDLHRQAASGELDHWASTSNGLIALIILLDQFSRNIHRGTAKAFASDSHVLRLAKEAVARGVDRNLSPNHRLFLYLPFEHSENLADQEVSIRLFSRLREEEGEEMQLFLDYAQKHKEVIDRFGRYPHRNAILSRSSTEEEKAFLKEPGSSF